MLLEFQLAYYDLTVQQVTQRNSTPEQNEKTCKMMVQTKIVHIRISLSKKKKAYTIKVYIYNVKNKELGL